MFPAARAAARLLLSAAFVVTPLVIARPASAAAQPPRPSQDAPVATLDGVEDAVVQIEAVGTFVDPEEGRLQAEPGFGSGFILDPSGIAVTNNHVVTGGALFKVFVSGRDEPVNARVLGASECYDIAVIDLHGDGYPYLTWYEGPIRPGLRIYAAGFPLGDPDYSLTGGIISKEESDGESSWSSLDTVLQHDAVIRPGNSGGPLVSEDGQVVGVNYAGTSEPTENYAIRADDVLAILDTLESGVNVESLGINGEAMPTPDGDDAIFVYSVESGSPADVTGIRPGDYILEVEGITVGADGIMQDYCDILASHDASDVLAVRVYRPETGETLEGQFNGRPLEASISIAEAVDETPDGADVAEYTYVPISDEAGIIHIEAPDAWSDITERDWKIDDESRGTQLIAAPDLQGFFDDWTVPGVIFSYSEDLQNDFTEEELLDTIDYLDQCDSVERTALPDDAYFTGYYDEYQDCGSAGTTALVAAMLPKEGEYMLGIEVYATTEADLKALDHILDTFYIGAGGPPVAQGDVGGDILEIVDTTGLEYNYGLVDEAYFSALLPVDWSELDVREWISSEDDEKLGEIVQVAPDIAAYDDSWEAPGMQAYLMTDIDESFSVEAAMDAGDFNDVCTFDERVEDVTHTIYGVTYTGSYDVYTDCDGADSIYYTGVFVDDTYDHAFILDLVSAETADDEAWEVLLQSFFLRSAVQPQVNSEDYALVEDESGRISLQAPVAWSDNESAPFEIEDEGVVGVELTIATDVDEYNDSWEVPGAYVAVWDDFGSTDADEVLDTVTFEDDCTYDTRYEYEGETFAGKYDLWNECGGVEGSTFASFALTSDNLPDALVLLYIAMPTPDDLSALEPILNTLRVSPAE